MSNYHMGRWNSVAKATADRRIKRAREDAIAQALARTPVPLSIAPVRQVGQMVLPIARR